MHNMIVVVNMCIIVIVMIIIVNVVVIIDVVLVAPASTEDLVDAQLVMSPDADLAGNLETARSTTGMCLGLRSKDGYE